MLPLYENIPESVHEIIERSFNVCSEEILYSLLISPPIIRNLTFYMPSYAADMASLFLTKEEDQLLVKQAKDTGGIFSFT